MSERLAGKDVLLTFILIHQPNETQIPDEDEWDDTDEDEEDYDDESEEDYDEGDEEQVNEEVWSNESK